MFTLASLKNKSEWSKLFPLKYLVEAKLVNDKKIVSIDIACCVHSHRMPLEWKGLLWLQRRKKPSYRRAMEEGELPMSLNEYRKSQKMQVLEVKQVITRNSRYVGTDVREEEVEMPSHPIPAPRRNISERIKVYIDGLS